VTETLPSDSDRAAALAAFHPTQFGFQPLESGWVKEFSSLGPVAIAALGWQHSQLRTHGTTEHSQLIEMDALELVVELQQQTWGMAPEELVPANVLAVLADSGGSVLVAYRRDAGFNLNGWLGFAISLGSSSGTLLSHMLGVRADARGRHDIGWYLKLIQGYDALRRGYRAVNWTFDPMRGANGRLNLEKLGAVVREFTLDKYGSLSSALYGEVPSDRFTANWDLLAAPTAHRLRQVANCSYQASTLGEALRLPRLTLDTLPEILRDQPRRISYQIPGDVDTLMRDDPAAAITWRQEMRHVLAGVLTTKAATMPDLATTDPLTIAIASRPGAYFVNGIATGLDESGDRQSLYRLERLIQND
jgi:predicted GNAT superfamily acetyltransferase